MTFIFLALIYRPPSSTDRRLVSLPPTTGQNSSTGNFYQYSLCIYYSINQPFNRLQHTKQLTVYCTIFGIHYNFFNFRHYSSRSLNTVSFAIFFKLKHTKHNGWILCFYQTCIVEVFAKFRKHFSLNDVRF